MIINRCNAGIFLFSTVLLFMAVISEGSVDDNTYTVSDSSFDVIGSALVNDNRVTYVHEARYIMTPDKKMLMGFDLNSEFNPSIATPLKISLGNNVDNKKSSKILRSVVKRLEELIEVSVHRRNTDLIVLDDNMVRYVNLEPAVSYIFQDFYHPLESGLRGPVMKSYENVSSLLTVTEHYLGKAWETPSYTSDDGASFGFFVVYIDQGIYLLIDHRNYRFIDLAGFRELVKDTFRDGVLWRSVNMTLKEPTWAQKTYDLFSHLLPVDGIVKQMLSPKILTCVVAMAIGMYHARRAYNSRSGSDTSQKSQKWRRKKNKAENYDGKGGDCSYRYASSDEGQCRKVCGKQSLAQVKREILGKKLIPDIKNAIFFWYKNDEEKNKETEKRIVELGITEMEFAFERVVRVLLKKLAFTSTVEEMANVINDCGNDKLKRKLKKLLMDNDLKSGKLKKLREKLH